MEAIGWSVGEVNGAGCGGRVLIKCERGRNESIQQERSGSKNSSEKQPFAYLFTLNCASAAPCWRPSTSWRKLFEMFSDGQRMLAANGTITTKRLCPPIHFVLTSSNPKTVSSTTVRVHFLLLHSICRTSPTSLLMVSAKRIYPCRPNCSRLSYRHIPINAFPPTHSHQRLPRAAPLAPSLPPPPRQCAFLLLGTSSLSQRMH